MSPFPAALCLLPGLLGGLPHPQLTSRHGRGAGVPGPEVRDLAGKTLAAYPGFQVVRTFNEGETVSIALDPRSDVRLGKRWADVFVLGHGQLGAALAGEKLASVLGAPLTRKLTTGGVEENTLVLDTGTLSGKSEPDAQGTYQLGRGYDVVVDVNLNAKLDAG